MASIMELAKRRADAVLRLQAYGRMSIPPDLKEQIKASALQRLAEDMFAKADAEYREAIRHMNAAALDAAIRSEK